MHRNPEFGRDHPFLQGSPILTLQSSMGHQEDSTSDLKLPLFSSSPSPSPSQDSLAAKSSSIWKRASLSALAISALLVVTCILSSSSSSNQPDSVSSDDSLLLQASSAAEDLSAPEEKYPYYWPQSKVPSILGRSDSPWNTSAFNSLRTAFHFQPENNWMNDPNAPMYYKGWYHLFYQYNPHDAFWGLISWGHAVSKDLIHWLYLDLAMVPDEWYDVRGVWTGSATFLSDGTPLVLYTGSTNDSVQVQNAAFPADPTDELLRDWVKLDSNPILEPPTGILTTDFRDPTTAWLGADGLWRIGIGSKINQTGIGMIYTSTDLLNWTLNDHYLHQVEGTGMWECLDFYPVYKSGTQVGADTSVYGDDVKHVIKASMDNTKLDYYTIGTYNYENDTFTPDDTAFDLGYGLRYDYGKFYASKTFYDNNAGRRILWGWLNESDSLQDDIAKGWASVQALPRQVWFDNVTKANLIQWPVEEFNNLRRTKISLENVVLESGSVLKVNNSSGPQWDIELTFENPVSSLTVDEHRKHPLQDDPVYSCAEATAAKQGYYGPFGLLVLASEGLTEQTAVYFYFTTLNGKWTALVCNDQSKSSAATEVDNFVYGYFVPVTDDETTLSLRVVVDRSIVETYAQGGRTCISSRIYPTIALEDDAHIFLFNNGSMPVTVESLAAWKISKVYMHPFSAVQ